MNDSKKFPDKKIYLNLLKILIYSNLLKGILISISKNIAFLIYVLFPREGVLMFMGNRGCATINIRL